VSIEYAMIRDVNDHAWRAEALARLLAGRLAHVNLIPLNPTPGSRWTASDPAVAAEFEAILASRGIPVTVRDTRGTEIDGACGQLAASGRPQAVADLPAPAPRLAAAVPGVPDAVPGLAG
jgi:23S rRNA (adenine2503-C2)-methyltransferase